MSPPAFAEHFRAHVGPKLRYLCSLHGLRVSHEDEGYSEAFAVVMGAAVRLGASHLPPSILADLEDTLHTWLMGAIEATWEIAHDGEAERQAARAARDVAAYFRAWEAAQQPAHEPWP